jgi:hypothetical protein
MDPDICYLVEQAVDVAFTKDKYLLNLYQLLKLHNYTKNQTTEFIESSTVTSLTGMVEELNIYLEKGMKDTIVGPAYQYLGKARARKIRDYINQILLDATRYENDRKPGRKKGSKNKIRKYTSK